LLCLTDTFYIHICVKHFGMADIKFKDQAVQVFVIALPLKMGPIIGPETSVRSCRCTLHKIVEERRPRLCRYGSLNSHNNFYHKRHKPIGFPKGQGLCSVCGANCGFMHNLDEHYSTSAPYSTSSQC